MKLTKSSMAIALAMSVLSTNCIAEGKTSSDPAAPSGPFKGTFTESVAPTKPTAPTPFRSTFSDPASPVVAPATKETAVKVEKTATASAVTEAPKVEKPAVAPAVIEEAPKVEKAVTAPVAIEAPKVAVAAPIAPVPVQEAPKSDSHKAPVMPTEPVPSASHKAPTMPTEPVPSASHKAPAIPTTPTQPASSEALKAPTSAPASASAQLVAQPVAHVAAKTSGAAPACKGFGPQTPRDIDSKVGHNKRLFSATPSSTELNLCNIHFHNNAEHKAKAFAIFAGEGEGHGAHGGKGGGYQCAISKTLTPAELTPAKEDICKGVKPGDTIEVHWVHSSCDVTPGKGLGSCLSKSCANPDLRVETQVFTVVNDPAATNFNDLSYQGNIVNGLHQAKALPTNTGKPVVFLGSTTGPKYTEQSCSPLQVTWSVRPECGKVDINSLGAWCKNNVFKEDHAHGVRKLVTNPALLSEIK